MPTISQPRGSSDTGDKPVAAGGQRRQREQRRHLARRGTPARRAKELDPQPRRHVGERQPRERVELKRHRAMLGRHRFEELPAATATPSSRWCPGTPT